MTNVHLALFSLFLFLAACSETNSSENNAISMQNYRDISAEAAASLIEKDKSVVVLDIRSPEEFDGGHIAGARNISYHDANFAQQLGKLDKTTSYVLHCHSGGRSGKTIKLLKENGFTNIAHMKSGIAGWRKAGLAQE